MKKKKVSRRALTIVSMIAALALVSVGVTVVGNDYRFVQAPIQIPVGPGQLEGVLTTPRDGDARGLVVMVHGDAAVQANPDELYSPWFEGAADAGFATLSWSKPGIGGSTGNWLDQSMVDRANEVAAVVDWARRQPGVPTEKIVLWGASQAGWVLPKVVAERDDIDAVVAVGTAINWLSQGRYNLLAELDHDGATGAERKQASADSDAIRKLLERGASYEEYRIVTTEESPMTPDRWAFVARNHNVDATADLRDAAVRNIPIFLMAGEYDRNVDIIETETVYREMFGTDLTVEHFDAVHSMARPVVDDSDFVGLIVGVFWPRALLAPGVIDT
ncbi:MAG: alpha/beta hydrolase family protein, partial [Microbacterium gubbeenense]